MRFSKEKRKPMRWGFLARTIGTPHTAAPPEREEDAEVPGYQQNAPNSASTLTEDSFVAVEADDPMDEVVQHEAPAVDPTQRLLTTLGRFQRQIAVAKDNAPSNTWADECMQQLINAVEIAQDQGWKHVVKVLVDTARILKSYEDAGQVKRCIGFLDDGNELICLIVGDIIVGATRSSAMEKWDVHYRTAMKEMESAGIRLVNDEDRKPAAQTPPATPETTPSPAAAMAPEPAAAPEPEPVVEAVPEPAGAPEPEPELLAEAAPVEETAVEETEPAEEIIPSTVDEEPEEVAEETPVFVEEPTFQTDDEASEPEIETVAEPPGEEAPAEIQEDEPDTSESPFVWTEEAVEDSETAEPDDLPSFDELEESTETIQTVEAQDAPFEPTPIPDSSSSAPEEIGDPLPADEIPAPAPEEPAIPDAVELLDRFCEGLSNLAAAEGGLDEIALRQMHRSLDELHASAELRERQDARRISAVMGDSLQDLEQRQRQPDDRFFELAYAFCGLYADASETNAIPQVDDWIDECAAMKAAWDEDKTADREEQPVITFDVPAEASSESDSEGAMDGVESALNSMDFDESMSPEQLLLTAQQAMSQGNSVSAKLFALQAAAIIGRLQEREAGEKVKKTEHRLQEGAEQITHARQSVQNAEQEVVEIESRLAEGEKELTECRHRIGEVRRQLGSVDEQITDIEERIRDLEAQRDAAMAKRAEVDAKLNDENGQEESLLGVLAERKQDEHDARMRLEDARQEVKNLERKRVEYQSAMERARDRLMRQRESLQDIEETIQQVRGSEDDSAAQGDLLF